MSTIQVTARVDKNTKEAAQPILEELGISMSTLFNMTLKQVVRDNKLPFTPALAKSFRPEVIEAFEEVDAAIQGKVKLPRFDTVDELFEELNS